MSFSVPSLKQPTGTSLLVLLTLLLLLLAVFSSSLSLLLPFGVCAVLSGVVGFGVIPWLQKLKAGQIIREDGPQSHLKKAGTPTMGGIFFVPVAVLVALLWSKFDPQVVAVSLLTLAYLAIGGVDDWQILRQQSNKGISPRMKLILQILGAVLFCIWAFVTQNDSITQIKLPGSLILSLGLLFWILAGFVLVAESNATNLTDGVDGLAGGTTAIALLGLGIMVAPTSPSLLLFCACLSGGCLGFIIHNRNPAKVFMGDTGSLALGGALAAVGILGQNLWGLFLVSGIFFVESLSVIAQVSYYKATKDENGKGKRLLKMAPLHHHLELSGWAETQIVGVFYLINTVLGILGIVSQ
ncbi:phospho-N-acetylmuramoyl-pentapeptide-transferase [Aphanothece hegewaldii]|uniref:phospho-N-acetylmuramoyl-pentapeptide- transferase n=1 Tax=Aphanothece hegewaldii TaxID=1521625 RepID=UPI003CCBFB49